MDEYAKKAAEQGENAMTIQEMKIRKKELHLTCRQIAEMAQVPQATVQNQRQFYDSKGTF